jgi:cytoskeleton protein RodZ
VPYDLKRIPRPAETTGAEAARLGDELRDARLSLGLSVEEIATRLRIRRQHLEALEEGRLGNLPGLAYAIGFVRSYAAALGLDAEEMTRRFRDASGHTAARPKLVFPEPVAERGLPAGAVMAAGAVIAVAAYVAWFNWSGGSRTVDLVPPVPPRLEQAAEQGRAQFPGREAAMREPGPLPLAALPPPGGFPASSGANTSAQAATVTAVPPPAPVPAPPVAAPVAAPPAVPVPAAVPAVTAIPSVPEGTRIVLRARASSADGAWVHVRDPRSGQVLVNRVLRPGEAWPVPARDGLLLDTGKADGLEVLVDGQPQPTLDGLVGVRRNIPMEPERLRQRLAPATASAATPAGLRN